MPGQAQPVPRALLLALLLLAGLGHAAVVPVSTAEEFLAALASAASPDAPSDTVVELQTDVALGAEAAEASYTLPFVIPGNRTLTFEGADGEMKRLDLGQITKLLEFEADTKLTINGLNISGMEDPQLGSWPDDVDSATVSQTMPFWPTVVADPGYTSEIHDSYVTLHPTDLCNADIGAAQFDGLRQLAESSGSNATDLYTNGTVGYFVDWAAPVPVLSRTTKVAIGTVYVWIENTTLHCSLAPEAVAPAPSEGSTTGSSDSSSSSSAASSGGGGTPGWVWAIVGVLAAIAVAAATAGLLWRRRRSCQRLRQQHLVLKPPDPEEGAFEQGSQSTKPGSEGMVSGTLTSAGTSFMLESAASGSVPEGPWKSRVGFIDGLQLGGLIGRGGYARVYKGRWKGTTVAVKVVETHLSQDQRLDLRSEPLLSLTLSHPNVLQGYKMCAVRVLTDGEVNRSSIGHDDRTPSMTGGSGDPPHSGGSHGNGPSGSGGRVVPHLTDPNCMVQVMAPNAVLEPGMYEMWLVSELADKGTLADAMKAGWFKQAEAPGRNLPAILLCLLDVARGLEYLHSCNIVHGDLKPQNVLLKTAGNDRRGFVCKLGDFGLSRMLPETVSHVDTGSYGTVTHASPELLTDGRLTKACDVFAFGIVLWELVTGQRLFPDMHHMQIIVQVTQKGYRPPIPPDFPPPLADLARQCWAEDPHARPDAEAMVQALIDITATFSSPATQHA